MRIGMEEAVIEDLLDHHFDRNGGNRASGDAVTDSVIELSSVEVLQREHALARSFAVYNRKAHLRKLLEVPREAAGVFGLDREVEFFVYGVIELPHQGFRRID